MRVLITNHSLGFIGGENAYTRDLAAWLVEQGHSPVVFGPDHGVAAKRIARLTVPVTDDLNTITAPPDVIHGNSPIETMAALLHFAETPGIFVCHASRGAMAMAPRFPRIRRYVAVDDTCADRLLGADGIPREKVTVLLNGVDLKRFAQRDPLPAAPRAAIVFGNTASELTQLPVVREACRRAGIETIDAVGELAGAAVDDPETILGRYDVAFAKGRAAQEAMASGLAVILCDMDGVGGMVQSGDVARLRRLNFGIRSLRKPMSVDVLAGELAKYDAADARRVSDLIRETASADALHQSLFALYEEAIAEPASADWAEESRAAAAFITRMLANNRREEAKMNLVVQAAHRILGAPVIGGAATRVAGWVVGEGRKN